jgi:hypothetical protein
MRWGCRSKRLPGWVAIVVVLGVGTVVTYALLCLVLAVYLWFNPIVF